MSKSFLGELKRRYVVRMAGLYSRSIAARAGSGNVVRRIIRDRGS